MYIIVSGNRLAVNAKRGAISFLGSRRMTSTPSSSEASRRHKGMPILGIRQHNSIMQLSFGFNEHEDDGRLQEAIVDRSRALSPLAPHNY